MNSEFVTEAPTAGAVGRGAEASGAASADAGTTPATEQRVAGFAEAHARRRERLRRLIAPVPLVFNAAALM